MVKGSLQSKAAEPSVKFMINTDLLDRLKEFNENEGKTCSLDPELITPLYVYRMGGRCYPDGRY